MTETPERKAMLDALRLELAQLFYQAVHCVKYNRRELQLNGKVVAYVNASYCTSNDSAWAYWMLKNVVPDWPRDTDAALALCLDIPDMYVTIGKFDGRVWGGDGAIEYMARLYYPRKDIQKHTGNGATPAEALSRLALAYYTAQADD